MARTTEQISDSIKASIVGIDNRLDLKVGPLWDYLISPLPSELAQIESRIEALKRYYSTSFAAIATAQEARDFAINFGTGTSSGNFARTTITFYKNSPPSTGIAYTVPVGALVQTIDGTLVYRVTQAVTMSGDYAATYFNPSSQRYEITTGVEAVSPGETYNIPANHIRKMQSPISGFDGVHQPFEARGGTDPEDSIEVAMRVQQKFKGLERNSIGGIETLIREYQPSYVKAVTVVKPTDRIEFRRLTYSPALDVYVLGTNYSTFTEDYLASGGEKTISITTNKTVTSITSVSINGQLINSSQWYLTIDTSLGYQLSTQANSVIQFETPLLPNDLVEITGVKNSLLDDIQALFLYENSLFQTDILVRSFVETPIVVLLECRASSGDIDFLRDLVINAIINYIQPDVGISTALMPDTLRDIIRESIPEIEAVKILEFRRKYGSIDNVEFITPYKNQVPIFDTMASSVTVRL